MTQPLRSGAEPAAPTVSAARYAGTRVARVEDPRLLTGHGTFVDDIVLPGMLHVSFVRSTVSQAVIKAMGTRANAVNEGGLDYVE